MQEIDLVVVLDVEELQEEQKLERHLKKEGFSKVEGEVFTYTAHSTTTTFSTKAYILEVFKKALQKSGFKNARLVFLLNHIAYPLYYYDHKSKEFEIYKEEK